MSTDTAESMSSTDELLRLPKVYQRAVLRLRSRQMKVAMNYKKHGISGNCALCNVPETEDHVFRTCRRSADLRRRFGNVDFEEVFSNKVDELVKLAKFVIEYEQLDMKFNNK